MDKHDFVIRFAGEGGQGLVTSADALARAAAHAGYFVQTHSTFPSQIMGGPASSQVRISTTPVLSSGDGVDVLVALNQYAYDHHCDDLNEGAVTVYNAEEYSLPEGGQYFGIKADELAKSTGNARAANMVTIGAVVNLIDFSLDEIDEFIKQRFTRGRPGDEEIIVANIEAVRLGVEVAKTSGFTVGQMSPPIPHDGEQVIITGNAALSLGAMAAGLNFYAGYPISPATSILIWMEQNLWGEGRFVHQVSSEIEAINAILGAGFAGKKAMSATAGPGFSLMSEGLGLAWMAEIPLVVANVQRGGPATGLPTKSEQSDLFTCMHPAHGDIRMPVLAPGSVEECFYAGALAVNWAERYQGPVIILSEFGLSERGENIAKPNLDEISTESRAVVNEGDTGKRYDSWDGTTPLPGMPVPGGPGAYVANGSEHDEIGDTTHLPRHHVRLMERRFRKLDLLDGAHYEIENADAEVIIMPWGSSKGPAREAYDRLRERGENVGWLYSVALHPLPGDIKDALNLADKIIVPELNYLGQWSALLRQDGYRAESITQYTGLPFRPSDLVKLIGERIGVRVTA
ncbi:MAG: 2-oxoacid:acceptor oxidoreductase subunit alpha [Chloroflexi bacterium]|nr:2-oxoacid:acceptor oxidoreductase subunit alpha [Chloroflexota bacterium]MCI0808764.1 2-oxoacid:acceptor oxidoreductase subunit alpha [Chloroflexota bacterium]MCI0850972.1 2-oxoacid:acceptor oxidoreductase subunit alpha [Chloroflexota bacterium]MCI0870359.1 2-oxoacid:acceptor oxidoreductase subunit alpha [Chloroflexota bacterium]